MLKKFRLVGMSLITALLLTGTLFVPAIVSAQTTTGNVESICKGVEATSPTPTSCPDPGAGDSLNQLIQTVVSTLSWVVGVVAVIMIMIGGFRFVTSGGDSSKVAESRNTIIYALIGLIVVALAQIMVHFVLNKVG